MTRLEHLIVLVAQNAHTEQDLVEIRTYAHTDVEKAIYFVCSQIPSWAIQNINQSHIFGKGE